MRNVPSRSPTDTAIVYPAASDAPSGLPPETGVGRAARMQELGEATSHLLHALNNTLAPILLCADLLREDVPADSLELVDIIASSARTAAAMVTQVEALSDEVDLAVPPVAGSP